MLRRVLSTMAFSPKVLLSSATRERCVANLKELPAIVYRDPPIPAAVLVPLCVINDEVCILYTKRSMNLKSHSGQISFPGGKKDGEETSSETALRETEEEIGLSRDDVDIWGQMPRLRGRNAEIVITPIVGQIKNFNMNNLVRNVNEVEEIFTVPISELCNPNNHAHLIFDPPLPCYIYGKHHIWGITGLITHMFLQCLLTDDLYLDKVNFDRKGFKLEELTPSKL